MTKFLKPTRFYRDSYYNHIMGLRPTLFAFLPKEPRGTGVDGRVYAEVTWQILLELEKANLVAFSRLLLQT